MEVLSPSQPNAAAMRVGFFRAASRWLVQHPGLVMLLTVMLFAAACVGQWWLSFRQAQDWETSHRSQPVPFRLFAPAGTALLISAPAWFALWSLSNRENAKRSTSKKAEWWRFAARERQAIFEGRRVSPRFLFGHGLFGLLGFALGAAVILRISAAVGWGEEILSKDNGPVGLVMLSIAVTTMAARRVREVLFLLDRDHFVGNRAPELAKAMAAEAQAEAEAEREYERRSITGWAYVVLLGGLFGALFVFLSHRWLAEEDGTTAFQGSVSGVIGSAAAVYLLKLKPRGWPVWLVLVLAAASGFLLFTQQTWHRSPLYLLLGVFWGAGTGLAATLLYLRKLRAS